MPRRRSSAQAGRFSNRRRSVRQQREGFIPNVYFNETFIECYTDLTDKRSKPKGEQVNFMESFKNANIESVPPLASASLDASRRGKISFANVKQESVTIFVSKAKEEAKDIFIYGRFEKVHDLINSKQCKEGFLSFLKAEHCDELLMLVDKIDETTRLKKTSDIEMANRDIFENFIREGAPMEVNLEPKLQQKLEVDYKDPDMRKSKVLFLPAKKELFRHLDFEFSRFKTSNDYADLEMMEREKDVEKWKNNFNDVINDQIGRRVLLHFMMLERNEENLLFVMAVQKMKSCHLAEEVKEHNQMIFDHFVGHDEEGAIPESVPSTAGENPTSKKIYDKAQTAIFNSIMDDSWVRFKESTLLDEYKEKPLTNTEASTRDTNEESFSKSNKSSKKSSSKSLKADEEMQRRDSKAAFSGLGLFRKKGKK